MAQPNYSGLSLVLDVSLEVSVRLGTARMQIRDILALDTGVVIELDKLASEPVDLLVNGRVVGHGEVVVIDEHFGIRIQRMVPVVERVS